jgi:hypothetical protein
MSGIREGDKRQSCVISSGDIMTIVYHIEGYIYQSSLGLGYNFKKSQGNSTPPQVEFNCNLWIGSFERVNRFITFGSLCLR